MAYNKNKKNGESNTAFDESKSVKIISQLSDELDREQLRSDLLFSLLIFALAKLGEPLAMSTELKGLREKDIPFHLVVDKDKKIVACKAYFSDEAKKEIVRLSANINKEEIEKLFEPETKH
jgi:hypothetical protein